MPGMEEPREVSLEHAKAMVQAHEVSKMEITIDDDWPIWKARYNAFRVHRIARRNSFPTRVFYRGKEI